jgi:hypothetical protein
MKDKEKIYVLVIAVLLGIFTILLSIYYLQDFSAETEFKDSLKIEDIELQQDNLQKIAYASAEIGEMTFVNNGIFDKVYRLPHYAVCVRFGELGEYFFRDVRFDTTFDLGDLGQKRQGETVNVARGSEMKVKIIAAGRPYLSPDFFREDNIEDISVIELKVEQKNFFTVFDPLVFRTDSCEELRAEGKVVKTLKIA